MRMAVRFGMSLFFAWKKIVLLFRLNGSLDNTYRIFKIDTDLTVSYKFKILAIKLSFPKISIVFSAFLIKPHHDSIFRSLGNYNVNNRTLSIRIKEIFALYVCLRWLEKSSISRNLEISVKVIQGILIHPTFRLSCDCPIKTLRA